MKREKTKAPKAPVPAVKRPIDRRHAMAGVVILLALFAYSNSFHAPFLLDNSEILVDTRVHAATAENVGRILNGPYHEAMLTNLYRPLTSLSYLYNYAIRGDAANPAGYHSFNFFVHAVNMLLVYALGLILFESIAPALALAALWGLHPVQTEAVTNIVGRADMLAATGVLGAVAACHHALRAEGWRRAVLLGAVAMASAVGAFSKEVGIVAVVAVLLYDLLLAREFPWRRRIPGIAAAAFPAVVFLLIRARVLSTHPVGPFPFTDNPIAGAGFLEGRMTAFKVIAKYIGLLLWPAKLSPDYSYGEIPVRVDAMGIAGLVLCLAAAAVAVWAWRHARALTFAIAFFFVALAPVANIFLVIGSIMGERFLYLPAVGFLAAVVYGLHRLWVAAPRRRNLMSIALAVVLVVFMGRAHARNEDWNDGRRFWESAVEAAPGSFKTRISLAAALPRTADAWPRILAETERALAILEPVPDDRNSAVPYRNAGVIYRAYGEFLAPRNPAEAEQWYRRSLEALRHSERIERKLDEMCREINSRRGLAQSTYLPAAVYRELGGTYLRLNDTPNAIQALEVGRNLASDPDLLEYLGEAYSRAGDPRRSAQAMVEALLVDASRAHLSSKLMSVYKQLDPAGCAVQRDASGESLNIACPTVKQDLCGASRNVVHNFLRRNQTSEAASIRRVAMQDLGCPASALD